MKTLITTAVALIGGMLTAIAQEDAREIAREMGANTTTSVPAGTDRYGLHRDTEKVKQPQQHVPNLLDAAQGSKAKVNKTEMRRLQQKRELLLKDREVYSEEAVVEAKKAKITKQAEMAGTEKEFSLNEKSIRKNAEGDWDEKHGKELRKIERALKKASGDDTGVRLHAPSLVNPK